MGLPVPDEERSPGSSSQLHDPSVPRRLWLQVAGSWAPLDRLREGIEAARAEQAARNWPMVRPGSPACADDHQIGRLIDQFLDRATQAYNGRDANLGWGFLHRVRETETLLMSRTQLDAVAVSLAAECSGNKVPGWRRDAIQGLLQRMHNPPYPVIPVADQAVPESGTAVRGRGTARRLSGNGVFLRHDALLVREALVVRNGYFSNTYVSLAVTAHRRLWLLFLGMLLVIAAALWFDDVPELDPSGPLDDLPDDLVDRWLPVAMAIAGALGSVVSAIQRLAVDPLTGPIPAQLGSFTATVTRPLIGAVAALTVYLAARGGLAVPEQHPVPLLLLAAFTAGLTERLVVYREGGQRTSSP